MRKTAFTDILLNWDKLSNAQKVMRVQEFENMISRLQGRKPRQIKTKVSESILSKISKDRMPAAYYDRQDPKNLYIVKLDDDGIEILRNVVHEGFHSYIDDFINGRVYALKLNSKLNSEMFYIQEENLPAISETFYKKNMMPLFDSFYVEERLNYIEDSIYISKYIIDSIENIYDAMQMTKHFILSLGVYVDNENRGHNLEKQFNTSYDNVVVEALNNENITEKVTVNKTGKIKDNIDPEYLAFFLQASEYYKEFTNVLHNPMMLPEMKEQASAIPLAKLTNLYKDYVTKILKSKRKF